MWGQVPSSDAQYLLAYGHSFSGMRFAHICASYEHPVSLEQVNVKFGACRTDSSMLSLLFWLVDVSVDIASAPTPSVVRCINRQVSDCVLTSQEGILTSTTEGEEGIHPEQIRNWYGSWCMRQLVVRHEQLAVCVCRNQEPLHLQRLCGQGRAGPAPHPGGPCRVGVWGDRLCGHPHPESHIRHSQGMCVQCLMHCFVRLVQSCAAFLGPLVHVYIRIHHLADVCILLCILLCNLWNTKPLPVYVLIHSGRSV